MDKALLILLLVAGLGALIALAVYAHKLEQQRLALLKAYADSMGWSFDERRDKSHDDEYSHFATFRRGDNRYAFNTMSGPLTLDGRRFMAKAGDFHYQVTRSNGKTTTTTHHKFSYLILETPFVSIPDMYLRREGVFDKIAGAMGFDDIDFESAEFSRKFHVSGKDKRFVYDVVTPAMMEFLMRSLPGAVELERGRFLITDGSTRWKPEQYPLMTAWADEFFRLWPRHIIKQLEEAASAGRIA